MRMSAVLLTFMYRRTSSHPLITCLAPSLKAMGLRPGELLASNTCPSGRNLRYNFQSKQISFPPFLHEVVTGAEPCESTIFVGLACSSALKYSDNVQARSAGASSLDSLISWVERHLHALRHPDLAIKFLSTCAVSTPLQFLRRPTLSLKAYKEIEIARCSSDYDCGSATPSGTCGCDVICLFVSSSCSSAAH